ncbi:hypothetical protein J7J84_05435 [bacterium]|nr:hypothetical protein [bacterium]
MPVPQSPSVFHRVSHVHQPGFYSPLWLIRNPSRKRAHLALIDEGESVDKFLIAVGAKEDPGTY